MTVPGEGLLTKMWETLTEKGIGSLLRPWQTRRDGRARLDVRREEIVGLAQAERDAEDIRAGRKSLDTSGRLLALPEPVVRSVEVVEVVEARHERPALQAAARIASDNLVADAIRKEVNVAKAVLAAEAELEGDACPPSSKPVDQDWLFRWRDYAGAVSLGDLQTLWGRVLAGEVKSPGSFSLRTLEFLKNLSHREALDIAKLSRFAIEDFIYRGDEILAKEGINFGFLLRMQMLGIISGVDGVGINITLRANASTDVATAVFIRGLECHGRILVVNQEDATKEITLRAYALTAIGREVIKLGTFEPHEAYLRDLGATIRSQGFRVQIARWQSEEGGGRYFAPEDL